MAFVLRLLGIAALGALGVAAARLYRQYQEDSAFDLAPLGGSSNGVPALPAGAKRTISPELLEILACPSDKQPVTLEGDFLVCHSCGRRYPIEDGIPIMLIEEGDKYRDESLITK
jgi:uncharacterized protein